MASVTEISEAELVDALVAALSKKSVPNGALTVGEFVELTGWRREKIQKAIGKLAMQDRIEVHQKHAPGIDGRNISRPAYKILPPKKKNGKGR